MKEDEVFWVSAKQNQLADDDDFVAAVRAACEAAGCRFGRFVAAMGPYGTWVVEIERDGHDQRILWNGKAQCLTLQVKLPQGGWEDPLSIEVPDQRAEGFVERVGALLEATPNASD